MQYVISFYIFIPPILIISETIYGKFGKFYIQVPHQQKFPCLFNMALLANHHASPNG